MSKVKTTLTDTSDNTAFYESMSDFVSQSKERVTELETKMEDTKAM